MSALILLACLAGPPAIYGLLVAADDLRAIRRQIAWDRHTAEGLAIANQTPVDELESPWRCLLCPGRPVVADPVAHSAAVHRPVSDDEWLQSVGIEKLS